MSDDAITRQDQQRELIRQRLRQFAESIPQAEVARRTGSAPANVHRFLREGKIPAEFCAMLVHEFQLNAGWLLGGEGGMKRGDVSQGTRRLSNDLLGLMEAMNAVAQMRLGSIAASPERRELRQLHDSLTTFERLQEKLNRGTRPAFSAMLDELDTALRADDLPRAATLLSSALTLSRLCRDDDLLARLDAQAALLTYLQGNVQESLKLERRVFARRIQAGEIADAAGVNQAVGLAMGLLDNSRAPEALRVLRAAIALSQDTPGIEAARTEARLFEAFACSMLGRTTEALEILRLNPPPLPGRSFNGDVVVTQVHMAAGLMSWDEARARGPDHAPKLRALLRHSCLHEDAERLERGLREFIGAPPDGLPEAEFDTRLARLLLRRIRSRKGSLREYDALVGEAPPRGGSPVMRRARVLLHRAQVALLSGDLRSLRADTEELETLLKASPAGEVSKTEWLIIRRRNLRAAGTRSRALREAAPRMEAEIAELVASGNRFLAEQA